MNKDLKMNSKTGAVILCCGAKRCPEVTLVNDEISIVDDHGGKVRITQEQAKLIDQAVNMLTDQNKDDTSK